MGLLAPPVAFNAYEWNNSDITIPGGTSVAAGTPAHSKNSTYTELIAATSFDAYWVEIMMQQVATTNTNTAMLVDIAIGDAGSETVIIPDLNAGGAATTSGTTPGGQKYAFPLYIPAGSRVSATAQAVIASDTVLVNIKLLGRPSHPVWAGHAVTAYGVVAASSRGTLVLCGEEDAGGSPQEGAYVEITSGTSRPHYYLAVGPSIGGDASITPITPVMLDLAIGAASEARIAEGFFGVNTGEAITMGTPIAAWAHIPASTRLAVRMAGNFLNGASQSLDAIVYGVS